MIKSLQPEGFREPTLPYRISLAISLGFKQEHFSMSLGNDVENVKDKHNGQIINC